MDGLAVASSVGAWRESNGTATERRDYGGFTRLQPAPFINIALSPWAR